LGVGGGIVIVPAAMFIYGASTKVAVGTSLVSIVPTALMSAYGHSRLGNIDWKLAGFIVAGSVVGALAGTQMVGAIPDMWIRRAFAVLLVATAVRMAWR